MADPRLTALSDAATQRLRETPGVLSPQAYIRYEMRQGQLQMLTWAGRRGPPSVGTLTEDMLQRIINNEQPPPQLLNQTGNRMTLPTADDARALIDVLRNPAPEHDRQGAAQPEERQQFARSTFPAPTA